MSGSMLAEWSDIAARAASSDATYTLRVKDTGGAVIATAPVTLLAAADAPAGSDRAFLTTFSAPDQPGATLELVEDSTVLTSLVMGPAVPAVTVSKPAAGETVDALLTVQWQATDANAADVLLYTIQYSPDNGATWMSLVADFVGVAGTAQSYTLDYPAIPATAGANQGRIRVLASDGYNTGYGDSPGFTVPNRKPEPYMIVPAPGDSFAAGERVTLRGMAFDLEDGPLTGGALAWTVLGLPVGDGEEAPLDGLWPGVYPVRLTATDALSATGEVSGTIVVRPLGVPLGALPSLDGYCTDEAYADAVEAPLRPYGVGDRAMVRLLRTTDHLWACFGGLKPGALVPRVPAPGATLPSATVGLVIDPNASGGVAAQTDDFAFTISENGSVATLKGNGVGGWATPGPSGFQAQMGALGERWSAELRVDKATLGGWDKVVGLAAAHLFVAGPNDHYLWPFLAIPTVPDTWARTALGDLPVIAALSPSGAAAGSAAFTLSVTGKNFTNAEKVLWDGAELPTTYVNATSLTAAVDAAKLAAPAVVEVRVAASASSPLLSNIVQFAITSQPPVIAAISPPVKTMGDPAFTLAVTGSGFHAGDTVFCGDTPLATTFVDAGRVNAAVPAAMMAEGAVMGITVHGAGPDGGAMSNMVMFTVQAAGPAPSQKIFLPRIDQ
jgi:hypothetical protein